MTTNGEGKIIATTGKKKRKRRVLCFTMAEELYPKAKERAVEFGHRASFSAYLEHLVRLDVERNSDPATEEIVAYLRDEIVRRVQRGRRPPS
jgi:hypothetical protein